MENIVDFCSMLFRQFGIGNETFPECGIPDRLARDPHVETVGHSKVSLKFAAPAA